MFVSAAWYPTDNDIVREMWVLGDLKDRLGIKHRRDRKGDAERTPMFSDSHSVVSSEGSVEVPFDSQRRTDYTSSAAPQENMHLSAPSPLQRLNTGVQGTPRDVANEDNVWDTETPVQPSSPQEIPLSRVSYYSISDLPPPSPLPETNLYTPTASPRTTQVIAMTSLDSSLVSPRTPNSSSLLVPPNMGLSPQPSPQTPYHPVVPVWTSVLDADPHGDSYEMHPRSPSASQISHKSESSYKTAADQTQESSHVPVTTRESFEDDSATIQGRPSESREFGDDPWRDSLYSQASGYTEFGPHAV